MAIAYPRNEPQKSHWTDFAEILAIQVGGKFYILVEFPKEKLTQKENWNSSTRVAKTLDKCVEKFYNARCAKNRAGKV